MCTTHYEIAGVLLFDGPANVTRVINVLFHPFIFKAAAAGSDSERYILVHCDIPIPTWRAYADRLITLLPHAQRAGDAPLADPAELLKALGHHFAVDTNAFADTIDFDSEMDIMDAVRLARLLADGHNLVGLSIEGAWYSDSSRRPDFGGWGVHETPRCTIDLSSSDVVDFACSLDDALRQGASVAASVVDHWFDRFVDGIADPSIRESLKVRYGLSDGTASTPAPRQNDWSRTLYVGAIATDEAGGPEWARVEVTPELIRRIRALRTACNMHGVSEICTVSSPDAWGPTHKWRRMPLSAPRLVVTADSFWFSTRPPRRFCDFETLPLSCHWLIDTFTGCGEPVYRRVNRDSVND